MRAKWLARGKRPVVWLAVVATTALAGAILIALQPFANQAVDAVVPGDDIQVIPDVVHLDDQGYSVATRDEYIPNKAQFDLMNRTDVEKADALNRQLRAIGGADVGTLSLRILLEGQRNQTIRIIDIYPIGIKREKPFGGTLFDVPPQAGVPNMRMIFNMDEKFPQAREAVVGASADKLVPGELFFDKYTISLPNSGQETVIVRATTRQYTVSFDLKLKYVIDDERREMTINNVGQKFRVTAPRCPALNGLRYGTAYALGDEFSIVPVVSTYQPSFC